MASTPTKDDVFAALGRVIDPELRKDVVELRMVRDIEIDENNHVTVEIALTTPGCPLKRSFDDQVNQHVGSLPGVTGTLVRFTVMSSEQKEALREQLQGGRQTRKPGIAIPRECRVIAVTSGKGGVGKSTVTTNLAAAMAARGKEVGLLDADVYGYSVPQMLGIQQRPVTVDSMMVPPVAHDVRLMSIGFFLEEESPVMWRGPMLHRALEQFLGDVHWGDIEYLFIDMPPGTGDVAISLGQLLPRAEVVVVTTPQVAAQRVALRAALMAEKMDQQVIGVVENMAGGIFGDGGGDVLAAAVNSTVIGRIPLDVAVREGGDSGVAVVASEAAVAAAFNEIIDAILAIEPPKPPVVIPEPRARIKKPLTML
ncbi:MAG: Mrp/NBP35 family ATP-binding protein [Thermoleophilia bacterium]|nr:Mrp/NBP35 family ATP-binding protein [Thermoleophilia bacterium]